MARVGTARVASVVCTILVSSVEIPAGVAIRASARLMTDLALAGETPLEIADRVTETEAVSKTYVTVTFFLSQVIGWQPMLCRDRVCSHTSGTDDTGMLRRYRAEEDGVAR